MNRSGNPEPKKVYRRPTVKKLTVEETKAVLLDHAEKGDQGAKDLLRLVLPVTGDREPDELAD